MSSSFELAGSVSDFDANAFRSKLAVLANANEEDVQLSVQSGSVLVDAQMVYADSFMAQSTSESLISMSAVHLSTALAVEVVVAPQVCFRTGCPNSGFPPTARPPSTASAPALPYVWNSMLWARTQVSVEMQAFAAPSPPPSAPPLLTEMEFTIVLVVPLGVLAIFSLLACVFCRASKGRRKTHPAELPALAVHHRQYLGSHQPQANHEQWRTPQRVRESPELPFTPNSAERPPVKHPALSSTVFTSSYTPPPAHRPAPSPDAPTCVALHRKSPTSTSRRWRSQRMLSTRPLRAPPLPPAHSYGADPPMPMYGASYDPYHDALGRLPFMVDSDNPNEVQAAAVRARGGESCDGSDDVTMARLDAVVGHRLRDPTSGDGEAASPQFLVRGRFIVGLQNREYAEVTFDGALWINERNLALHFLAEEEVEAAEGSGTQDGGAETRLSSQISLYMDTYKQAVRDQVAAHMAALRQDSAAVQQEYGEGVASQPSAVQQEYGKGVVSQPSIAVGMQPAASTAAANGADAVDTAMPPRAVVTASPQPCTFAISAQSDAQGRQANHQPAMTSLLSPQELTTASRPPSLQSSHQEAAEWQCTGGVEHLRGGSRGGRQSLRGQRRSISSQRPAPSLIPEASAIEASATGGGSAVDNESRALSERPTCTSVCALAVQGTDHGTDAGDAAKKLASCVSAGELQVQPKPNLASYQLTQSEQQMAQIDSNYASWLVERGYQQQDWMANLVEKRPERSYAGLGNVTDEAPR